MTTVKEIGQVKKKSSIIIQQMEWKIPDFFIAAEEEDLRLVSSRFPIEGLLWHLRFWPSDGELFLASQAWQGNSPRYLPRDAHREYSLEYDFGVKKCDGTVGYFVNGIVEKNEALNIRNYNFITKAELLKRKSELVPGNALTIVCKMKWMVEVSQSSAQLETLDSAKALQLIRLEKLSDNFKDLFSDKESCDVTLKVQDKEYKAHKSVLIARSSVFAATFKHDTLEKQTGVVTITDCDPDSFQEFLHYLYCGKLKELSLHSALNLYYTSDKYNIEEMKTFCVEYLMQCLKVENICKIVVFADKYDEEDLFSKAQGFFNQNAQDIFATSEWECLLKRDYRIANKLLVEMAKVRL